MSINGNRFVSHKLVLTPIFPYLSPVGHHRASFSVVHFTGWRNVPVDVGHHLSRYHGDLRPVAGQIGPLEYCCLAQCFTHHHWIHRIDFWHRQESGRYNQKFPGGRRWLRSCGECHRSCPTTLNRIRSFDT